MPYIPCNFFGEEKADPSSENRKNAEKSCERPEYTEFLQCHIPEHERMVDIVDDSSDKPTS